MGSREEIAARRANEAHSPFVEAQDHGTYYFELQLVELVRQGSVVQLERFLQENKGREFRAGKLADDPLRQAQDVFIGLIASVAKHGAISGGLGVELAYQLIDLYVQAAERAASVEAVRDLQYNMLLDLTDRVGRTKLPPGISNDVFVAMQFIHAHFTEGISVEEAAAQIGRSRAYLQKKFREEVGQSVGKYIADCRMHEAQTLLKFTGQSLAEISEALGFSSQAYFQNAFRKTFGITPGAYRRMQGMGK